MSSSDLFQNLDNIQKNFDPQPLLNDQQLVAFGIEYSNSVLSKLNVHPIIEDLLRRQSKI
jgi:hypothetical protein